MQISAPLKMNGNNFGDRLTFPPEALSGQGFVTGKKAIYFLIYSPYLLLFLPLKATVGSYVAKKLLYWSLPLYGWYTVYSLRTFNNDYNH